MLNLKDVVIGLAKDLDTISISDICCIEGNYHLLYLNAKKYSNENNGVESFREYLKKHIEKTSNSKRNEVISINVACKHLLEYLNEYDDLNSFINDLKLLLISIEEGRLKFHEELTNNHDLKMIEFVNNLF